jgi:hypothetical protein
MVPKSISRAGAAASSAAEFPSPKFPVERKGLDLWNTLEYRLTFKQTKRKWFVDMAKRHVVNTSRASFDDNAISLFDRENLESLDALRYQTSSASVALASRAENGSRLAATVPGSADQIFAQYQIRDTDETWGMGELNVQIIHRGRIRIRRTEWQQVIGTCSAGFSEDGIRKDFHLNILEHPRFVRLVYISYRYKQAGDKQREHRRGILLDEDTNIADMMRRLAYWFTAQPHAESNYSVFETLVDEAMTKLTSITA